MLYIGRIALIIDFQMNVSVHLLSLNLLMFDEPCKVIDVKKGLKVNGRNHI